MPGSRAYPWGPRLVVGPHGGQERRKDRDVERVLRQLWSMANAGSIDGLTIVAHQRGGGHHLIIAGECMDDPLRADGALTRLREILVYHPSHPLEDFDGTEG